MREPKTPLLVLFAFCAFAVILFSPSTVREPTDASGASSGVRGGAASGPSTALPEPADGGGGGGVGEDVSIGDGTTATTDTGSTAPVVPSASPGPASDCLFPDTLLVIGFGHPVTRDDVIKYANLYSPFFDLIAITGEVHGAHPPPPGVRIHECNSNRGQYQYACVAAVVDQYPRFGSVMYVSSHTLVFPWEMAQLDRTKVWTPQWEAHDIPDAPGATQLSYELLDTKKCKVRHNIAVAVHMEGRLVAWAGNPSFVYLPSRFIPTFSHNARSFKTCRTPVLVGLPSAVHHALAAAKEPPLVVEGLLLPTGANKDPDHWFDHYSPDARWVEGVGFGGDSWERAARIFAEHAPAPETCAYNPYAL